MRNLSFSIVLAVYNRAEELQELLTSLTAQTDQNFEVIVADDHSTEALEPIVKAYAHRLNIRYFYKNRNTGTGLTCNEGSKQAAGNYLLFLDSDAIVPPDYVKNVRQQLTQNYVDAFGGGDTAHHSFTPLQKAISYAMTSFLTTGGIRGSKNSVDKFQLRGFNMGVSKPVFESLKGFLGLGFRGEDIDFCLRLWRNGYATRFFENCTIFHKRRTSLIKFAKQVYDFGIMRPILNQRYPEYSKITFWFPTLFLVFSIFALLSLGLYFWIPAPIFLLPFIFLISYDLLIFLDASFKQKSLFLGLLALVATKLQFFVYGSGFLKSFVLLNLLKKDPKAAFPHFFYRS